MFLNEQLIGKEYESEIEHECHDNWPFCNIYDPTIDGNSMLDFTSGAMRMFHQLVPSSFSFYTNCKLHDKWRIVTLNLNNKQIPL